MPDGGGARTTGPGSRPSCAAQMLLAPVALPVGFLPQGLVAPENIVAMKDGRVVAQAPPTGGPRGARRPWSGGERAHLPVQGDRMPTISW
ncbi:hypothetical protein V6U90_25390 [Micromonospora sp. CPCC 206060]|uniref:hypothetical protein n=1 Tax=Micromonospora sp. CPCC 206060 TaxID=3122406 RepID=UPI002FF3C034